MVENRDYPRIQWPLFFFTALLILAVFGLVAPGGTGQAEMATDLDCTIQTIQSTGTETRLRIGPMQLRTDADLTASPEQARAWKNLVNGFLARYVGLCEAYQDGEITKDQFEFYTEKLKDHYEDARQVEGKLSQQAQEPDPTLLEAIHEQHRQLETLELPEGIPSGVGPRSPDFDLPPDPNKPPSTTGSIGVTPQQESEK